MTKQPFFALIDCNNFFVSCERLFRPDLARVPTVVMSSNDGCAVARSNEAKSLGIAMGEPLHLLKARFHIIDGAKPYKPERTPREQDLVVFSANFKLYGEVSRRVARLLTKITPRIELYSIDEAFLDISQLVISDPAVWGKALAARIAREIGVPVSVGIAPTKTLCKIATNYAKHHPEANGAYVLHHDHTVLDTVAISDVWGIGWRLTPRLKAEGLHTALDLAQFSPHHAQQLMGIHGRRLVSELNGLSCLPLQTAHKPQQMISRGRQFGHDTNELTTIEAAIAYLVARAAAELRRENLLTARVSFRIAANRHKPGYHSMSQTVQFRLPTDDTGEIVSRLVAALESSFDSRHLYHRAEITLWELHSNSLWQPDIFSKQDLPAHASRQTLMRTLDAVNAKYGSGVLRYAAEDLSHDWYPRRGMQSPAYTTEWSSLPIILAK